MTTPSPNPEAAELVRIALLIDADNVHPAHADEIFSVLGELGVVTLRRAYGNFGKPEVQKWHAAMRQHAIAPVHQHDLVAGKNATDIRLAIDAIELVVEKQCDVLAIASSDSDFSPLAIRLRERGVPVIGFAQRGKSAADLAAAFDTFHLLGRVAAAVAEAAPAKRPRRAAKAAIAVPADVSPAVAATSRPPAKRAPRAPAPAPQEPPLRETVVHEPRPMPQEVDAILAALPDLRHSGMALNSASEALRRAGVLKGRSASPSRLFKRYPELFALRPPNKPESVHFIGPRGA